MHEGLTALGRRYPVLVVDDGSTDPDAVHRVVDKHGAKLISRAVNGGTRKRHPITRSAVTPSSAIKRCKASMPPCVARPLGNGL